MTDEDEHVHTEGEEIDKMAMLERVRKIYELNHEMLDIVRLQVKKHKMSRVGEDGMVGLMLFAGSIKTLKVMLEDVHHALGHAFFDACWATTNVGEEFEPNILDQLKERLTAHGVVEVGTLGDLVDRIFGSGPDDDSTEYKH